MRQSGKICLSLTGYRWLYGACAFHAGYLRLQTHSQNLMCTGLCIILITED